MHKKNIQMFRKTIDLYNLSVYNVKHSTIKMCERQTQNLSQPFTVCLYFFSERSRYMLITEEMAKRVRVKRAIERMTAKDLAEKLNTTHVTLTKVEQGDYDAPRRIYNAVMEWLAEDY